MWRGYFRTLNVKCFAEISREPVSFSVLFGKSPLVNHLRYRVFLVFGVSPLANSAKICAKPHAGLYTNRA